MLCLAFHPGGFGWCWQALELGSSTMGTCHGPGQFDVVGQRRAGEPAVALAVLAAQLLAAAPVEAWRCMYLHILHVLCHVTSSSVRCRRCAVLVSLLTQCCGESCLW